MMNETSSGTCCNEQVVRPQHVARAFSVVLSVLAATASCAPPPATLPATLEPKVQGLRILLPVAAEVITATEECRGKEDVYGRMIVQDLRVSLERTGLVIVTDSSAPHDTVANVELRLDKCYDDPPWASAVATVDIEAGATEQQAVPVGPTPYCNYSLPRPEGGTCLDPLATRVASSLGLQELAARVRRGEVTPTQGQPPAPPTALASAQVSNEPQPGVDAGSSAYVVGAPQRNAYAFVVGIDAYRDAPAATGAKADAERFAELAQSTLGLPKEQVRLVVNERAGLGDLRKGLKWLKSSVPAGGRAYFYFAGHGAPDASAGTPYLLPWDGDAKELRETAIELQEVMAALGETAGASAVAVVDACFSGAGGRSVLPEGARPLVRVTSARAGAKVALFSAASGAEISGPAAGRAEGLFTATLLEGLGRGTADVDGNGDITLAELATWLPPRVKREAAAQGREQTPSLILGTGMRAEDVVLGAGLPKH